MSTERWGCCSASSRVSLPSSTNRCTKCDRGDLLPAALHAAGRRASRRCAPARTGHRYAAGRDRWYPFRSAEVPRPPGPAARGARHRPRPRGGPRASAPCDSSSAEPARRSPARTRCPPGMTAHSVGDHSRCRPGRRRSPGCWSAPADVGPRRGSATRMGHAYLRNSSTDAPIRTSSRGRGVGSWTRLRPRMSRSSSRDPRPPRCLLQEAGHGSGCVVISRTSVHRRPADQHRRLPQRDGGATQ